MSMMTAGAAAWSRTGTPAVGLPPALWYDASDASARTIVSNAFVEFADKSGNGYHANQSGAGSRAALIVAGLNGRDVAEFLGSQWYPISGAADLFRDVGEAWVASVFRVDAVNTQERPVFTFATNAAATRFGLFGMLESGSGRPTCGARRLDGDSLSSATNATSTSGEWVVAVAHVDFQNRIIDLYINGSLAQRTTSAWTGGGNTSNTASLNMRFGGNTGAGSPGRTFRGRIAELKTGVDGYSDEAREREEGILAWKWGLAGELPMEHPYKNAPPVSGGENDPGPDLSAWENRLHTPTHVTKIGGAYFCVDCWHHRIIYTDDIERPIHEWQTLDDDIYGGHSITTDGTVLVADDTERGGIRVYASDGLGGWALEQSIGSLGTRTHRVQYDAGTDSFYVLASESQEISRLTRSGTTLTLQDKQTLGFLGSGYTRSFSIIDGKMYFVSNNSGGRVYEVSFDGASTYTLDGTYNTPSGFTSLNDISKATSGDWYLTATTPAKVIEFADPAAMHASTYVDRTDDFEVVGIPYYIEEFDGALWVPEYNARNAIIKVVGGSGEVVHDYGTANGQSIDRKNAGP